MEQQQRPISINLKLISCKDIRAFNFFQKLTLYAVVSIDTNNPSRQLNHSQKQQQRTQTHRDPEDGEGSNPEWNHEARFDLGWVPRSELLEDSRDKSDLFLRFKFRHDGVILSDKLIGECHVPLTDLIRDLEGLGDDVARFVSYEVRNGDGKPNGIFNFSYRVKGVGAHSSGFLEGRISGYHVVDSNHSQVQYPTLDIEKPCCYPPVTLPVGSVQEGVLYPPPQPPPVLSPSSGKYHHYYYPPPPMSPPCPYPPPPPPPPVAQYYPPFGPGPHRGHRAQILNAGGNGLASFWAGRRY